MRNKSLNPIALLGFLGLIGIVGIITEQKLWLCWFSWFTWFASYNNPTDERFYKNIAKTGLIGFIIAITGFSVMVFMRGLKISPDIIFRFMGLIFAVILVSFNFVFQYLEKQGD